MEVSWYSLTDSTLQKKEQEGEKVNVGGAPKCLLKVEKGAFPPLMCM